jgi:hypothetical protein
MVVANFVCGIFTNFSFLASEGPQRLFPSKMEEETTAKRTRVQEQETCIVRSNAGEETHWLRRAVERARTLMN